MWSVSGARRLAPLGAALLAACAGNGAGLDANGQPIGAGGVPPPPLTADFKSIQDNILTPICTHCHSGAGAPEGLELDAAHSYALLVGVSSNEDPGRLRVKPGSPDNSYLVLKLQGSPGIVGAQMPFGAPPLPQSTIDVVRQWISDGAVPAATGSATATGSAAAMTFAVTAISPRDRSRLSGPVRQIIVAFSHEVDASLLNETTLRLESVAADGAPSVALSARLAEGNPSVVLLTPPRALGPGSYRLTLRGSGGGALADVNAQSLGSDFRSDFTVDGAP
jgi:hypothetical protein